jgi:hypothetical protein
LGWDLGMQVIGTGREVFHHEVQEPRETDANGTADPTERDALGQLICQHFSGQKISLVFKACS